LRHFIVSIDENPLIKYGVQRQEKLFRLMFQRPVWKGATELFFVTLEIDEPFSKIQAGQNVLANLS